MEKLESIPIHPIQSVTKPGKPNTPAGGQQGPVVMSKKAIKRRQKLIQKKLGQGLKTLSNQEKKKIDDFISNEPTATVLVLYFGNGQEEDYSSLDKDIRLFSPKGLGAEENWNLDVFPGFMHGFIEFKDATLSSEFMGQLEDVRYGCLTKLREIVYKTEFSDEKMRYTFFFYSKLEKCQYEGGKKNEIPDSQLSVNIPGLLVYQNFVTE
jgi:hypothetical protein